MKQILIGDLIITLSEPRSKSKDFSPCSNYIVVSFMLKGEHKEIYLAPKAYKLSVSNAKFYLEQEITHNINLLNIPHGTSDDCPDNTLPLFIEAARKIDEIIKSHSKVLLNCNHGRSRSGTVLALFMMNHLNLKTEDAISVVTEALSIRGYKSGIDLKGGVYGTYGDWLRTYKPNKENLDNSGHTMALRKRKQLEVKPDSFFASAKKSQPESVGPQTRSRVLQTIK